MFSFDKVLIAEVDDEDMTTVELSTATAASLSYPCAVYLLYPLTFHTTLSLHHRDLPQSHPQETYDQDTLIPIHHTYYSRCAA